MDGGGPHDTEQDAQQQSLLGSSCSVRGPDAVVRRGQLLEVRCLWTSALLNAKGHARPQPPLYGFVRLRDVDHRMSGWFPVGDIELKTPKSGGNGGGNHNNNAGAGPGDEPPHSPTTDRILGPILSSVYREVTPGMVRTRREEKLLDFFEERLLRDCRTPTTVRYFVYLCTYVFSPWYYAPYGLFHSEYDPLALCSNEEKQQQHLGPAGVMATNPYIRDAFLCPFSLRIYSTFEQMRHETKCYRAGRLRPPGQEIYRDEARGFSMFEVNGSRQVTYCRYLFLLGKSFLENKLAGHDVHNYYFYVVCLHHRYFPHYTDDPSAMYFVGYFTWEKQVADHNLACIVTLPCFAGGAACGGAAAPPRLGHFGQFMIAASYELAYRRKQVGSPERPLSDLGASAYERYWRRVLIAWMHKRLTETTDLISVSDEESNDNQSVVITAAPSKSRASKRPRASDSDKNDGLENDDNMDVSLSDHLAVTSVRTIAEEVRLEEADVLRTLLNMGVLHRNAEDRSLRLVVPVAFVRREHAKAKEHEKDVTRAVFDASLMTARGGAAWTPTAASAPLRPRQRQPAEGH